MLYRRVWTILGEHYSFKQPSSGLVALSYFPSIMPPSISRMCYVIKTTMPVLEASLRLARGVAVEGANHSDVSQAVDE